MKKGVVISGAILILIAIILGAFGAHALKEILSENSLASFETGVRYQMYMGLAILMLGLNYHKFRKRSFGLFYGLIFSGSILFSFSIYALVLSDYYMLFSFRKILGPITPLGGSLMIVGWTIFCVQFINSNKEDEKDN
jgi:uncharacterized membrane protein YgdD (TMEM256/DUF423 family)